MSSTNDYFSYTAVDDAGVKTFSLRGGAYAVTLASDAWGTVALEILSANGETFVPFVTWSSNTAQVMNLPAGHYQFAYSGMDTAALSIVQQPTPGWPMPTNLPSAISSGGGITTYGPVGTDTEIDIDGGHWLELFARDGVDIFTEPATGSDNSGEISLGSADADSGNSGNVSLLSGNSQSGNSGSFNFSTGNAVGANSGHITLQTGTADGTRGSVIISANAITSSTDDGYLQIQTADSAGASADLYIFTGNPADTFASGSLNFGTGNNGATGNTGDAYLYTGDASDGNSGNVFLTSGTASGTRGSITLDGLHVLIPNLPTSSAGLPSGALWNNSGTVKVV
jgi:hypothetical protein